MCSYEMFDVDKSFLVPIFLKKMRMSYKNEREKTQQPYYQFQEAF